MQISRSWKILLGVATAIYIVYPFLLGILGVMTFLGLLYVSQANSTGGAIFFLSMAAILLSQIVFTLFHFGLIAFYLVHIIKNKFGAELLRAILGVGMVLFPFFAMPFYYILFIWMDEPPEWAIEKSF
jgi:hypothetical protein